MKTSPRILAPNFTAVQNLFELFNQISNLPDLGGL